MNLSYHVKFLLYIESTHRFNEEDRNKLVEFAEEQLPAFLRSHGYPNFGDLYSCLDPEFWKRIGTDGIPSKTDGEREYASMVMKSLKYFKGFLQFDKNANYKKLFEDRIKREKKKALANHTPPADYTQPEEAGKPRSEGEVSQVCVTHYERNPEDRKKVLERDNYECQVCHMRFVDIYGEIGKEYIEVHHLYPVCNMGDSYQFDPLDPEKGLVCLCSNCHSMIHRGGHYEEIDGERKMVPMTLKALQELYDKRNPKE